MVYEPQYEHRFYRNLPKNRKLNQFSIKIMESDLLILCDENSEKIKNVAKQNLRKVRRDIERYLSQQPIFATSLEPIAVTDDAPAIAADMAEVGKIWKVGPMAAVAGAIAEYIGRALLEHVNTVIVENGGDIYARSDEPVYFGLYAGEESPFKDFLTFAINAKNGLGICTSSGKVGPSLSFGKADAVVAIHRSASFADAAATALANRITNPKNVETIVEEEKKKALLDGMIACCGDKLGMWGDFELVK